MSVAFSPDGTYIVSGSEDGMLRFWDTKTGKVIGDPLKGHKQKVRSVAFSPDGTYVVSGSEDMMLRVWPRPKVWPALLCAKLTHNMTDKEWRNWVSSDIDYLKQCPILPRTSDASAQQPATAVASEKSKQGPSITK